MADTTLNTLDIGSLMPVGTITRETRPALDKGAQPQIPVSSTVALRVIHAYRTGCSTNGTSAGVALDVEVKGYKGKLLLAGVAASGDNSPLIAVNLKPASNDWRHRVKVTALLGASIKLAAGKAQIRFGMERMSSRKATLTRPLTVTVPAASTGTGI